MKTPIAKASAVRSGGSSSASKRRKVAQTLKQFEFKSTSDESRPNLSLYSSLLFETIQGFRFIVVGVEYGQQLGYDQQVLDLFG